MAVTAAIVASAAIAAGAQYASSASASSAAGKAAGQARNAPVASYNPAADPLVGAVSQQALFGLGQPTPDSLVQQSDPLAQVLNIANQSGRFTRNEIGAIQGWLPSIYQYGVLPDTSGYDQGDAAVGKAAIQKALSLAGYSSPDAFYQASKQYREQQAAYQAQIAPVQQQILQGRLAAYQNISKLAQDFPQASQADIDALSKQYEDQIRRQLAQDTQDQRDQILQQANSGRINPAATLGRLAQQESLSRSAAPTTALERALQLLTGKTNLATTAIAGNQAIIDPGNNYALNVANLRSQAALNAAQLISGQNQQNQQLQANLTNQQGQATANGIAGAGNALSGIGQQIQMQQILNQLSKPPGVQQTAGLQPGLANYLNAIP